MKKEILKALLSMSKHLKCFVVVVLFLQAHWQQQKQEEKHVRISLEIIKQKRTFKTYLRR